MKICPKCSLENPDTAQMCERCCSVLSKVSVADDEKELDSFFEKQEKTEKRQKIRKILPIPIYYVIFLPMYIVCVWFERGFLFSLMPFLLCPLAYYLLTFKAELLFRLEHTFDIYNLEEVKVSEWYLLTSAVAGWIFLAFGVFVAAFSLISHWL